AGSYIRKFADENIRVVDLCRAARVSQRTLEYAFQEKYGVNPKSFLLALRLNNVRRELRAAQDGQKIVDIANRWGFWHMGQFAADYRKHFDELPSQTLGRVLA
ncbi:MAG: helix-turn-helix domain-containing protein, partial [Pirellulaceae bacterium]